MTNIEWTDAVWNPVSGCTKVSAGCANCYAERMAKGDLFHKDVPFDFVALTMQTIAEHPQHTFQILTKRPGRMARWFREWWRPDVRNRFKRGGRTYLRPRLFLRRPGCSECRYHFLGCLHGRKRWEDETVTPNFRLCEHRNYFGREESICDCFDWHKDSVGHGVAVEMNNGEISVREQDCFGGFPGPLKNVWLGVSCEDQRTADRRIPELLKCPAAVRFVSCEPLLEPIELTRISYGSLESPSGNRPVVINALDNSVQHRIDWIIAGGESGPAARPMHPDWVRSIRDECRAAGVPFFFKQWGGTNKRKAGRILDGRTWEEVPGTMNSAATVMERPPEE